MANEKKNTKNSFAFGTKWFGLIIIHPFPSLGAGPVAWAQVQSLNFKGLQITGQ